MPADQTRTADLTHEPGPWSWEAPAAPTWRATIFAADGRPLVHDVQGLDPEQRAATARLIAAAPDLLEVLRTIDRTTGSSGGAAALVAEFRFLARQAIAKAVGGAS